MTSRRRRSSNASLCTRQGLRVRARTGIGFDSEKGKIMDNKDQAKGKIKQAVGDLTGNKDLKRHGKADERAGNVKGVVKDTKDKIDDVVDKATDKLTKR